MFEHYPALLVTKLFIPRPRSSHVARDPLLAVLSAGVDRRLILIAASAGSGKTTLVADWSGAHADSVGWLSLDEGDNDPARFLSYLIAAVQTRRPQVGQELLSALQSPQPPTADNALPALVNQLAALPDRLILVLDDYHVIANPAIHGALSFLLDHLPPQVTLVIMTRTDPPLPLSRLRARNDLLELRAADLRFSVEETEQFLNQIMQLNLAPQSIVSLETRTEGWIAGLQLAALALNALHGDGRDQQAFVENFTGSHHFVLDYLIEEVLSRQPENVRRFLLATSILQRLCGPLCSAVMGEADSQSMLLYLERNNLFLVPLDQSRTWYRYHHLFADLLLAHLQAESPDVLNELRQRAAHWHEDNGLPEEAIVYALSAKDYEYAAQLIVSPAASVTRRGEVATLLDWYRQFPADFVTGHPRLSLQFGMAFALGGRWDEAETLLGYIEAYDVEARLDEALILAYLVASYRHDTGRLAAIAAKAEANPKQDRITKLVLALVVAVWGDLRRACQLLAEAQEASQREGDPVMALTALFHQTRYQVFLGNLHRAYELCQTALQYLLGSAAEPNAVFAFTSLGRIMIEWNRLDEAEQYLQRAIQLVERSGFVTGVMSSGMMMLAEAKQARGDTAGAIQTAQSAIACAERSDPPPEAAMLKTYQTRLWLIQGNLTEAADWLRDAQRLQPPMSIFYPTNIHAVTQARVLLAQRKNDAALTILTRLAEESYNLLTVETLALLALARQARGDSVHALLTLEQALTLAETENRVRAFVELGAPMAVLLTRFIESHPGHSYARTLLSGFPAQPGTAQAVDMLSDRELEVLRLIVAGHSNDEIAQALTIAVSTVKWYVNTLYGKLHVKTRAQAIARAHELKLLAE